MVEIEEASFEQPISYVGRYALFESIAKGGFATVHLARSIGAGNFARTVAIKRLHRQFAQDPEVSAMFLDEAHLVARIRHPNVLPTLDLVADDDELMIVMEYVEGVTLRYLLRHARKRNRKIPLGVVLRCLVSALRGLNAAHEARNEKGERLNIIHRDVSPDNILIGTDGLVRLLDFGVAKALGQYHDTKQGEVRGKLAYMTPEQVNDVPVTHRSDIFSAAIVLWEAMTGDRLFSAKSVTATAHKVLTREIPLPSEVAGTPRKLDGIVLQGLEREPSKRWPSAERFAAALEAVGTLASEGSLAQYVRQAGADRLRVRARQVRTVEAAELDLDQLEIPNRTSMVSTTNEADVGSSDTASPLAGSLDAAGDRPADVPEAPTQPSAVAPLAAGAALTDLHIPSETSASDSDAQLVAWTDPPRSSLHGGARTVLPIIAAALALVIVVLLLTGGSETDADAAKSPPSGMGEPAARDAAKTAPKNAAPTGAASDAIGAPSATLAGSASAAPSQSAEPQSAEPQTAVPQTAEPQTAEPQTAEPPAQPKTAPARPYVKPPTRPKTRKKKTPIYGRE